VKTRICLLLIASALLAAPAATGKEDKPRLPRWKKGVQKGTVEIDGRPEGFVALVPRRYNPKKTWPVVLLAHGNGGKAASFLQAVKPYAGKQPPLLISLERCDNKQNAEGYVPKYLEALATQFSIRTDLVFALGFSGGGFRLWDDVIAKKEEIGKYRGVILVGSAKQNFPAAEKPDPAATIILVGDPVNDGNFKEPGAKAKKELEAKGYELIVHEHAAGHSLPAKEMKAVFEWIAKTIKDASKRKRK
jgi:predicted esterase